MSKIKTVFYALFLSLSLIFSSSLFAADETITITTYYPSPYGSYNEFSTTSNTTLATTSGNVGIGTSVPTAKLHVSSTALAPILRLNRGGSYNDLTLWKTNTTGSCGGTSGNVGIARNMYQNATSSWWSEDPCCSHGGIYIDNLGVHVKSIGATGACAGDTVIASEPVDSVFVNTAGSVGIGTTAPTTLLNLASTGTTRGLRIAASATTEYSEIQLAADGREYRIGSGGSANTAVGPNNFYIWDVGVALPRVVLNTAGNIGIGTTSPDGKIDIQAGSGGTALAISANYPKSYRWRLIPTDRGGAIDLDFTVSGSTDVQESTLRLTHSGSGRPEFALLTSQLVANNGNIGIGTTNPGTKLEVNGNIKLQTTIGATATPDYIWLGNSYSNGVTRDKLKIYLYSSGTELYGFSVGSTGDIQYHSNSYHDFYIANTLRARIDSAGDFWTNDGGVHSLSDIRLKNRIRDFTPGLSEIMRLSPAIYHYKAEMKEKGIGPMTDSDFVGLSAQDVQKVIPEAVKEENGYLSLSTVPITYTMINAIKEQQKQIDELKQEIRQLKHKDARDG